MCTASMQGLTYLKFSDFFDEENKESVNVFLQQGAQKCDL